MRLNLGLYLTRKIDSDYSNKLFRLIKIDSVVVASSGKYFFLNGKGIELMVSSTVEN